MRLLRREVRVSAIWVAMVSPVAMLDHRMLNVPAVLRLRCRHNGRFVYLSLATLPCDAPSAFLVFSDGIAYPVYICAPSHDAASVLSDRQCAGGTRNLRQK